ncbi:MAG TPA: hypothetical protein VEX15_02430 [Nocardioidaceae bacterium]|nr:hypothetical protein [Nocardioidaceae bacterium]
MDTDKWKSRLQRLLENPQPVYGRKWWIKTAIATVVFMLLIGFTVFMENRADGARQDQARPTTAQAARHGHGDMASI